MHQHHDFDAFAQSVVDATARGDVASVRATIRPVARIMAVEHGARFRDLVGGLPTETWHDDVEIAAAMGQSYRANGSPRGQSALGYFRAAEDALAITPDAPRHCLAAVLIGHTAALRTLGLLDEAHRKSHSAREVIENELADDVPRRMALGAQWALEEGMLRLHLGEIDAARAHLEYAHGLASVHLSRAEHIECLGAIAMLDAITGEVNRTVDQIGYAKSLAEGTELMATGYGAPALIAEVMVANERFDLALSLDREPAMLTAAAGTEWEPLAHAMVGQSRALHGSFVEALDQTEVAVKGYSTWDSPCFGRDFSELLRAALLLGLGHADACWAILQMLPSHEHHVLCPARITAQLRIMHGDLVGAEEAIAHCEAMGTEHCARTDVDIHLIRAAIEEARGNTRAADVSADRAFFTLGRTGARAGLQRVPGATLNALAKRALTRRHRPEVQRMLTEIVERHTDHDREVDELSPRERHVLAQVQRGVTVAAIAAELYISPNTVKTHLRRIYRKLGVSTRDEAIRAARSLGLNSEITRDSPVLHRVPVGDAVV